MVQFCGKTWMIINPQNRRGKLEQKMIEIVEKQGKIRKIDENFSFNNLPNCTLNFNFN